MSLAIDRNPLNLHPTFALLLLKAVLECHSKNFKIYPFEGMRSVERQASLFEQGRTKPGAIVTNAKPWESWHNYGLAVDLVFDGESRDGIQWSWNGDYNTPVVGGKAKAEWDQVAVIMEAHGFEWAGRWKSFPETPHFQFTGGYSTATAKTLVTSRGLKSFWDQINPQLVAVVTKLKA